MAASGGDGVLEVAGDAMIEGALFVFDAMASDQAGACLSGGWSPQDVCTVESGCVLKLYQAPMVGPEGVLPDGIGSPEINFRIAGVGSPCDVQWAGGAPTALCPAGDDDCDGDVDEAVDAAGASVQLGTPCGDDDGGADTCGR